MKYQRCVRFSEEVAVFGIHGCDSGVWIWVDIFPETFGHQITLHHEGPEEIVLPIKLLDDWGANLVAGAHNLLVCISSSAASVDDGKSKSEFIYELIKLVTLHTTQLNLCMILCTVRCIYAPFQ